MARCLLRRGLFAGLALLLAVGPARAQFSLSGSGGSNGASSTLGGSGGSSGGSSGAFNLSAGNNFLGTTSGTSTSLGGARNQSGTTSVGGTSFLGPSFNSARALGLQGLTTFPSSTGNSNSLAVVQSAVFGNALFNDTPSTTNYTTRTSSSSANIQTGRPALPVYASSVGVARTAQYITEPRFKYNPRTLSNVEADVRSALRTSSRVESKDNIRVAMDGAVVVLRGTVADPDERTVVEDMVRLTPGVNDVRNELAVRRNAE